MASLVNINDADGASADTQDVDSLPGDVEVFATGSLDADKEEEPASPVSGKASKTSGKTTEPAAPETEQLDTPFFTREI